jgi:hypothetical protein
MLQLQMILKSKQHISHQSTMQTNNGTDINGYQLPGLIWTHCFCLTYIVLRWIFKFQCMIYKKKKVLFEQKKINEINSILW